MSSLVLGPSAAERTSDLFVNWTKHIDKAPRPKLTGPNTKHTSTHAEPFSLYNRTKQNCLLFLSILCNNTTKPNIYYLFFCLYFSRCPVRFRWQRHLMRSPFTAFCQNYIQKLIKVIYTVKFLREQKVYRAFYVQGCTSRVYKNIV